MLLKNRNCVNKLIECVSSRNKVAEIYTPIELINDMLNQFPQQVWKCKSLTWFDPCAGVGNFEIEIYKRYMEGLKDVIIDNVERHNHIIHNMLYMCELNHDSYELIKLIFGDDCNAICCDTLQYNSPIQYDIIIGNPPYNTERKG